MNPGRYRIDLKLSNVKFTSIKDSVYQIEKEFSADFGCIDHFSDFIVDIGH